MIDKTKTYRFKGDSERWESSAGNGGWICGAFFMNGLLSEHLHARGLLLEYPELPGEDWEFCEREEQEKWLNDIGNHWGESKDDLHCPSGIYCRKKKAPTRRVIPCLIRLAQFGGNMAKVAQLPHGFDESKIFAMVEIEEDNQG